MFLPRTRANARLLGNLNVPHEVALAGYYFEKVHMEGDRDSG